MKSIWKSFLKSAMVVGVSTCSTTTLVADDTRPNGIMRTSQPARTNANYSQPRQANQAQPIQYQAAQNQAVQNQPVQYQQVQNQVGLAQPVQYQAVQAQPVQYQAVQAQAVQNQVARNQVVQTQAEGPYAPAAPAPIDTNAGGYAPTYANSPQAAYGAVATDGSANYAYTNWTMVPRQDFQNGNWRQVDWQTSDGWGSGLRARTQANSLAFEQALASTPGTAMYGGPMGPVVVNNDPTGNAMIDYFKCKFGYFIPSGGGGKGLPWAGHYARVYPVNPAYSDPRDGQAYAAQGYGVPISVPLAPVVGHTYEYSNGIPSSRLVPVSHPAN